MIVAHEQEDQFFLADSQAIAERLAVALSPPGGEPLDVDAVVDLSDPLRGDAVILLEIAGAHLRDGHHDPLGIAELPVHEFAEGAVARQDVDHLAFDPRSQGGSSLSRCSHMAMREPSSDCRISQCQPTPMS